MQMKSDACGSLHQFSDGLTGTTGQGPGKHLAFARQELSQLPRRPANSPESLNKAHFQTVA